MSMADWHTTCPDRATGHCYHYTGDHDAGEDENGEAYEPGGDPCCWCGRDPFATPADAVPELVAAGPAGIMQWEWKTGEAE